MSQVFVDFFAKTHLMTRLLITVACPAIISRDTWFASPAAGPIDKYTSPPAMVIVHHSKHSPCNTTESCIVRMLELQRLHQRDRHWFDFGYNFGIGGDGSVYEGRGWDLVGAAAKNYNDKSINIVFLGHFTSNVPSTEMLSALRNLIDCGVRTGKVKQDYKLVGFQEQDTAPDISDTSTSMTPMTPMTPSLFSLLQSWPHWSPMNMTAEPEPATELKLALLLE